jgi:opacity protein-like surface antigen
MRKIAAAVVVGTLCGGLAQAADVPLSPTAAYFVPTPARDWNGFYVGGFGGWSLGRSSVSSAIGAIPSDEFDLSGATLGATVGFNHQIGSLVWGIEADAGWTGISGSGACFAQVFNCKVVVPWLGTGRIRLGWAYGDWLPYVTGGFAVGSGRVSSTLPGSQERPSGGWTAGAGLEVALSRTWSAKAEYLFVDLDRFTCDAQTCLPLANANAPFKEHMLRFGVNYRFD